MGCKTWLGLFGALAVAAGVPFAAQAASDNARPPLAEAPSAWTFDGGLYAWAMWVQGDVTTRGLTFDVYADPVDLIDALDGPIIMANFEARRGRFALYADVVYAKFAFDSDFLGEAQPIPDLTVTGDGRIGADYEFGLYQADGFYEVAKFGGGKSNTTFELGGGARWVRQKTNITAAIDVNARLSLVRGLDLIESRINRIQNQQDRLQSLAELNALRQAILSEQIVRAENRGLQQRVARLENRLNGVDQRGEAIAALQAVDSLRFQLLRAALSLDNKDVSNGLAFVDSGTMEWVDPVVAMRMKHDFGDGTAVTMLGDVGGFRADDFSWQAVISFEREGTLFGFLTTTSIGYKALGLRFVEQTSRGERGQDVVLHGPTGELKFRW